MLISPIQPHSGAFRLQTANKQTCEIEPFLRTLLDPNLPVGRDRYRSFDDHVYGHFFRECIVPHSGSARFDAPLQ